MGPRTSGLAAIVVLGPANEQGARDTVEASGDCERSAKRLRGVDRSLQRSGVVAGTVTAGAKIAGIERNALSKAAAAGVVPSSSPAAGWCCCSCCSSCCWFCCPTGLARWRCLLTEAPAASGGCGAQSRSV